jgi:prepilin-type processing-associated H-X9-DG protein
MNPADLYSSTGAPTSLISLATGAPVGLGLLLPGALASQPKVLFCPGSDQPVNEESELAQVGLGQAQCSYYYRHAGNTNLFDSPTSPFIPANIKLDSMGLNDNGQPIRALALDTMFLCPPEVASFGVTPSTHHQQKFANILFCDGHAVSRPNTNAQFTVDVSLVDLSQAFAMILGVLQQADTEP